MCPGGLLESSQGSPGGLLDGSGGVSEGPRRGGVQKEPLRGPGGVLEGSGGVLEGSWEVQRCPNGSPEAPKIIENLSQNRLEIDDQI